MLGIVLHIEYSTDCILKELLVLLKERLDCVSF